MGPRTVVKRRLSTGKIAGMLVRMLQFLRYERTKKKEWFKHFSFNHFTRIGVILVFWFYKNKKQERKKRSEQRIRHTDGPTRVPRTYQNSFI